MSTGASRTAALTDPGMVMDPCPTSTSTSAGCHAPLAAHDPNMRVMVDLPASMGPATTTQGPRDCASKARCRRASSAAWSWRYMGIGVSSLTYAMVPGPPLAGAGSAATSTCPPSHE